MLLPLIFETWTSFNIILSLLGAIVLYSGLASARNWHRRMNVEANIQAAKSQLPGSGLLSDLTTLIINPGSLVQSPCETPIAVEEFSNFARVQDLRPLHAQHEVASTLIELFDKDGAGAWPPKAKHDNWPLALAPFKDIYLELIPLLSASEPSLDDETNEVRRERYRCLMRNQLKSRVDIARVQTILAAVETGTWDLFPRDAYNGFYCCVAVCRHAYRYIPSQLHRVTV